MRDPRAVVAVLHLTKLVGAHLRERLFVLLRVALDRDLRGHATHRVDAAAMTGLDEQARVRAQETLVHRDEAAVGERHLARALLLDEAEDVVPPAAVQARRVLAELVEDLVHLERRGERLDEHRRLDRPLRDPDRALRVQEHHVPQARLEVALELGQVEVRAGAALEELARVVEEIETEVDERASRDLSVDDDVLLRKVEPARPNEQHRRVLHDAVFLLGCVERERATHRFVEVLLTADDVVPGRRVRVLEVGHEDARARVERVDDHLLVDRSRDLDASIADVLRHRRADPVAATDVPRLGEEIELVLAGVERALAPSSAVHQLGDRASERPLQIRYEGEGLRRENLGSVLGSAYVDRGGHVVLFARRVRTCVLQLNKSTERLVTPGNQCHVMSMTHRHSVNVVINRVC